MADLEVQPEDRFAALIAPPQSRRAVPLRLVIPAVGFAALVVVGVVLGGKPPPLVILPMPAEPLPGMETALLSPPASGKASGNAAAVALANQNPAPAVLVPAPAAAPVAAVPAPPSVAAPVAPTPANSAATPGTNPGTAVVAATAIPTLPPVPADPPLKTPSFDQIPPPQQPPKQLSPAPLPALEQATSYGPLPIIAGGQQVRIAYAAPTSADPSKPRLAILVTGLGMARDPTNTAISKLPGEIDMSFSPYAGSIRQWIANARSNGHESLLDLPLEPPNFPNSDAGPMAVMSRDAPSQAIDRLDTILGKATAYVGVVGTPRSPVAGSAGWGSVLHEIATRGLLYVGDGLTGVTPSDLPASARITIVADEAPFRAAIDARFAVALADAQRDGSALVMISARPVTFERLLAFLPTLAQKGVTLVPVSALAQGSPVIAAAPVPTNSAHP